MPVSVHALAINERTFEPEWNGHRFSVTYRPSRFTPKFQRDYVAAIKHTATDAESAAWWLSRVVISWDILGDDEQPLPLDQEWLSSQDVLDVPFMWWVIDQINEDRRPKAKGQMVEPNGTGPDGASDGGSSLA